MFAPSRLDAGLFVGGKLSDAPLAEDSAARIVKRYARRVGLDPASYAGHSLRSGFLTSAAESGAWSGKYPNSRATSRWTRCAAMCGGSTCSRNMPEPRSCNLRQQDHIPLAERSM